jgi:hypothetical protein
MKKTIYTFLTIMLFAGIAYSQTVTTLWEKSEAKGTRPIWDTGSLTRGLSYGFVDGKHLLFVANRHASVGSKMVVYYDAATGDSLGVLDLTGVTTGVAVINDIEVSTDGKIFLGNMTTSASADPFKVYRYDSLKAVPSLVLTYNSTAERFGDKFTVTGSTADNSVVIWAANATAANVLKFSTTDNGLTFTPTTVTISATGSSPAVGPLPDGGFYFDTHGLSPTKYSAEGVLAAAIPTSVVSTSGSAIRYMGTVLGAEFMAANELTTATNNGRIIQVPNGNAASAVSFITTPVLGTLSAGGLGDISVQKVSNMVYNVYVLASNNGFGVYTVDLTSPLSGDYYIPKGANPKGFSTLNDAVASLNLNGATGTVNFLLDADTLREATFTFNAALSAENNVVVKPAAGRNVILFVTAGVSKGNGIQMIGFDKGYVTFDGSNDGTDSRNLIVSTEIDAVAVPFGLNTANADYVTLKNLIIKNFDNVTLNFRYGAVINDVGGVDGFRVENCQIGTPERPVRRDGIATWGGDATANNFIILNNEIYAGVRGVTTLYLKNCEIRGNTINLIPANITGGNNVYNQGIYITGGSGTLNITENVINCLNPTAVASAYIAGIAFAGNSESGEDWFNISNNMINMGAASETRNIYGIGLVSTLYMGNLKLYHNTIVVNEMATTIASYGIGNLATSTGAVNIDLKNNIIINKHTGNVGSSAIGLIPAASVLTSNYNNLYSLKNLVNKAGTLYADLPAWQAAGQDANSVSKEVFFVSATDLHLTGASNGDVDLIGWPLAEVTKDIDGDNRDERFPYMGADEAPIVLPVELTAFSAKAVDGGIQLSWTTATEMNNSGFEIERKSTSEFVKIGFVTGKGTSVLPVSYSFVDNGLEAGVYYYRLKQIDFNGTSTYSNVVEADLSMPIAFGLNQNYPNPFNPATTIKFQIAEPVNVTLTVYNALGAEVAVLIDNQLTTPGQHTVQFNASKLASGTYIYRLTAGSFVETRKMVLMK